MTESIGANDPNSWRQRLGRRLATLTVALTAFAYLPLALATSASVMRVALVGTGLAMIVGLLATRGGNVSHRTRSIAVILAFVAVGSVGYATVGFQSGPGAGFAAGVAFAGLLLGRRAMRVTAVASVVVSAAIAAAMVNAVIAAPSPETISPMSAGPWVRSVAITFILITILAAAVVRVVEGIEQALERLGTETEKRHAMELQVAHGQSMQMIAQLAASLAHDVNNQLTVISSWSDVAARAESEADRQESVDAVHEAVGYAAALTRQMLLLARRDVSRLRDVSIGAFLSKHRTMLGFVARHDVELTMESEADLWCHIDESHLSQIVMNLAMNSCDAMPDGGRLTIRAERQLIEAGGGGRDRPDGPTGDWVTLRVEDDGAGMDEATQARAFEPFFSTKSVGEGTGLGLATVNIIVEGAGGRVTVDSAEGRGTTVTVWLPAVVPVDLQAAAPATTVPSLTGARVLLVDDSTGILESTRRILADAGAQVRTAGDGDEALAAIDDGAFDLLVSDVVMPGTPVIDVAAAFRLRNPSGAVLLCSGYVGETLVRHGIEEGRFELLAKPYTSAELIESLAALRPVGHGADGDPV